jgi:hypothetical protein
MVEIDIKRKFCVSSSENRIELFQRVLEVTEDDRDTLIQSWVLRYILETLQSDRTHHIYDDDLLLRIKKVFGSEITSYTYLPSHQEMNQRKRDD